MKRYLLIFCFVVACSPHKIDYDPEPLVKAEHPFFEYNSENLDNGKATEINWWHYFNRPNLDNLIEKALQDNYSVKGAVLRLKQAEALARKTQSGIFPQINIAGAADKRWEDGEQLRGESEIGGTVNWEIDLFKRISSVAEADKLTAEARREDVEAVRLILSTEIANTYFSAAAAKRRLALLNEQLKTDKKLLDLLKVRKDNGVGTNLEVLQQQSRVAESKSLIPPTENDIEVFENRLDVLLGQIPDGKDMVSPDENLQFSDTLPPVGVPANLLTNRPDLRAVQAELVAADADIASAVADRLPRITLDGSYLYSDTSDFTGPASAIIGRFVQPLLDWGKRKAEVERNKYIYEEKLVQYTQFYLEAVEEVENALKKEKTQREFIRRLEERRHILQKTKEETEARYIQGVDDYLPVLNALQELREVERDIVNQQLVLINNRILLHKAIGGAIKNENNE